MRRIRDVFRFVCMADEQTDAQPRRSVGEQRGFFSGDVAPERRTRPSTCQTVCGRGAASTAVVVLFTFRVVTIPVFCFALFQPGK